MGAIRMMPCGVGVLVFLLAARLSAAQCPGHWVQGAAPTSANVAITKMCVLTDGRILAVGNFSNDQFPSSLGLYDPAQNTWQVLQAWTNDPPRGVAALPNGDAMVVGCFTTAGTVGMQGMARYSPATNQWTAIQERVRCENASVTPVIDVRNLPNGDVLMAGAFSPLSGPNSFSVLRYEPGTDTFTSGRGFAFNSPTAIGGVASGEVFVASSFFSQGPASAIERFNDTAEAWEQLSSWTGYLSSISAIASYGDTLFVGGHMQTFSPWRNVAKFDASTQTWSPLGPGTLQPVQRLGVLPGGDVVAADQIGGVSRFFTSRNAWRPLATGVDGTVNDMVVLPGGDIVVCGTFQNAGGVSSPGFARYTFGSNCAVDFNCSGTADIADIFEYLSAWLGGEARAEYDGAPGLSNLDLLYFIADWFDGC
jgi:hypothetical protein